MKRLVLLTGYFLVCYAPYLSVAQEKLNNNGFNLASNCVGDNCKYITLFHPIHFPNHVYTEWLLENIEIAIKRNGRFLVSGDLHIIGKDTAAIIQLEFLFVNESNQNIHRFKTEKFEFFNEPDYSEPVFFGSNIPVDLISEISTVDVEIRYSKKVPDFEISSNCYLPCKQIALKGAIKAFRKSK